MRATAQLPSSRTRGELGEVIFEPADPPRAGRLVLWEAGLPDLGEPGRATIVRPPGDTARAVGVRRLPVAAALPLLLAADADETAAARFWGAAARFAVQLVARGRLLPGVSPGGFDAWRVGPLDPDDAARLRELAAAMPPQARAIPVPRSDPPTLPA
ncbi:MAG: hypothetical protein ACR2GH_21590, partial [Pseudonocardia sp.]